jgi:hypothetical protein
VRVPTAPADIPLAYPSDNHHVVVVRNNRYFKVDTKGRGKAELAEAFAEVKRMADGTPGEGVGVLCADDRDVWTEVGRVVSDQREDFRADSSSDAISSMCPLPTHPLFRLSSPLSS